MRVSEGKQGQPTVAIIFKQRSALAVLSVKGSVEIRERTVDEQHVKINCVSVNATGVGVNGVDGGYINSKRRSKRSKVEE